MRYTRLSAALAVAAVIAAVGFLSASTASAHSCRSAYGGFALHVAGAPCSTGRSVQRGYQEQAYFGPHSFVIDAAGTTWRCRWRILRTGAPNPGGDTPVVGQVTCDNRRKSARVLWKYSGAGA